MKPFNMIILGMTGCGKTHYLLEMLEKEFKGQFESIFLLCPTFVHNETYQIWKYKDDEKFFALPCDQNEVEDYLKHIQWYAEGEKTLIILDDCAATQSVKNRTSELVKLCFHGRHVGFSTIVVTQQLTSIAKPYRDNIQKLTTFYNPSSKDTKALTNNYLAHVEKSDMKKILETLRTNQYARLEISLEAPYNYEIVLPKINY